VSLRSGQPINAYLCPECGVGIVTIDRDEGVTPFLLRCRGHGSEPTDETCKGISQSCFYRPPRDAPEPTWEWYRPSEEEARAAGRAMYEHHAKGGLFLRRIAAAAKEG